MVKKSKLRKYSPKSIAIKLTIILVLATGLFYGYLEVVRYRTNRDQIEMVTTRELIIAGVENAKQPAVIDAKTGDIYFPPEKLYLPYSLNHPTLIYSIHDDGSGSTEFTISDKLVMGGVKSKLYSAQNVEKMLYKVPELQACLRGLRITYEKRVDESEHKLHSSHILKNGKTIYIYSEKEKVCTQLDELAEMLKNLQSY